MRPKALLEYEAWELELLHSGLPRHYGKLSYPAAQLVADFREMFFPKPEPGAELPKPSKRERWTPEECLPYFADLGEAKLGMSAATAKDLLEHRQHLPVWAADLINWAAAEKLAA